MRLRGVTDGIGALVDQMTQHHAHIETGATDAEVIGRPFAPLILSPGLALPGEVRLEAAAGQHAGEAFKSLAAREGRHKAPAVEFDPVDRCVIPDRDTEPLGTAVVGVHQRFAAAHEKRIGT